MRVFFLVILLIFARCSFSQTIEELEYELSFYRSGEQSGNKKDYAYKLLEIDELNSSALNYLIEIFGRNNQRDSIKDLFDRITRNHPNNPEVYLVRVRGSNAHFAGLTYTQQINYLRRARDLDSTNTEALYKLGEIYYKLFVREFNIKKNRANLVNYAKNSINYFSELCEQDEAYNESLRFPLIQLVNYMKDSELLSFYENYNYQSSYFPIGAFLCLPKDWRTNYSINVLDFVSGKDFNDYGVEFAVFKINWYSKHLYALNEPVLSDTIAGQIFRFTWLRSFHNPIVVRIENIDNSVKLYWKVSDGAGGYEPGEIIENQIKDLTMSDWERFSERIDKSDFWNLPTVLNELTGTDGAQWILEGKTFGKYHVVDRWGGASIYSICMELLEMTNLKIQDLSIY